MESISQFASFAILFALTKRSIPIFLLHIRPNISQMLPASLYFKLYLKHDFTKYKNLSIRLKCFPHHQMTGTVLRITIFIPKYTKLFGDS